MNNPTIAKHAHSVVEIQSSPKPLTFWKVAFAVMAGNLLTAIVCGIIYALTRM